MLSGALPNDDVVITTLHDLLVAHHRDQAATIVDLGGGTGVYAVPLAERGHRVEVLDQSADALATLRRRAESAGVSQRVVGRTADLDALDGALTDGGADLVLCHRVLEYVDDPAHAIGAARAAVTSDGRVSILVAGRTGAALSHLIAGRFDEAGSVLDPDARTVQRRFDLAGLTALLDGAALRIVDAYGVGLIGELNPSLASSPAARAAHRTVAQHPELRAVAPLLHVIARPSG